MNKFRKSAWAKVSVGIILLFIIGLFLFQAPLKTFLSLQNVVSWVEMLQANMWGKFLFFMVFVVAVLCLPITLFPIIGGILFGFSGAMMINMGACLLGSIGAFGLARILGRDAIEAILRGKLRRFDQMASRKGFRSVLFIRWMGVPPFLLANYALGLSGIKFKDYFWGTFLGILPWMAFITYASGSLWEAVLVGGEAGLQTALLSKMGPIIILSLVAFIVFISSLYIKRKPSVGISKIPSDPIKVSAELDQAA